MFIIDGEPVLVEQARSNALKTRKIMSLYDRMKADVPKAIRSQYTIQAIDALFDRPIFQSRGFANRSGIPKDSALRILNNLKQNDIVRDLRPKRGRRGAIMIFSELVQITEE